MNVKIISCAVTDYDGIIYSLPAPARHHHILNTHGGLAGCAQGFLTSEGKFVARDEAWRIAEAAKQIVRRGFGRDGEWLFSENLW